MLFRRMLANDDTVLAHNLGQKGHRLDKQAVAIGRVKKSDIVLLVGGTQKADGIGTDHAGIIRKSDRLQILLNNRDRIL